MKKIFLVLSFLLPVTLLMAQLNIDNIAANSNGTITNTSDDYIVFSMKPVAPTPFFESPYTYMVTATQGGSPVSITLSDGSAATNVGFANYTQYFRLANGTAGKGNVVITINPNWGAYANTIGTVTDPGTLTFADPCTAAGIITYEYNSPTYRTELSNRQAVIPQFNMPGKTLTGVSISYNVLAYGVAIAESRSNTAAAIQTSISITPRFKVGAGPFTSYAALHPVNSGLVDLAANQLVAATGIWLGDNTEDPGLPSTLKGMNSYFNIIENGYAFLDPRLSPQWITNITGVPATADDDIAVAMGSASQTGVLTVSPGVVSEFSGAGNAPIALSTLTGLSLVGGGGNLATSYGAAVSYRVSVTYTFTSTPCQPVSGSVYLDQDGLANGIKNQSKFTQSSTIGLKAVLVDANGIAVGVANVDASGNFSFPNVAQAAGYTVRITTQPTVTVGAIAPVATLGAGSNYAFRGEFNGAGTGNDGSPDGMSAPFTVGATPVTLIDFAIYDQTGGNPLSANITNVVAKLVNGQLLVNFTTLGENNNSYFAIEASRDGENFTTIGKVDSKAVNGKSTAALHYDFTTNAATALTLGLGILLLGGSCVIGSRRQRMILSAITAVIFATILISCSKQSDAVADNDNLYIRIAQVDKDGAKTYSKIVKTGKE